MRARKYNKRFEVWSVGSPVDNGFGGKDITETLVTTTWGKIRSIRPGSNIADLGIVDANRTFEIEVRKRNDLDYNEQIHFFKYRGKKYTISTAPTNVDFDDRVIVFIVTQETVKSNTAG